jgi:hypothetical protein
MICETRCGSNLGIALLSVGVGRDYSQFELDSGRLSLLVPERQLSPLGTMRILTAYH